MKHRRLFLILWTSLTIVVLVPVLFVFLLGLQEKLSWTLDPAGKSLESTCGRCHESRRPRLYAKSPDEWRKTLDTMFSHITDADASKRRGEIEKLLIKRRSADPKTVFKVRCGLCHAASVIDRYMVLDDNTLGIMVRRHVIEHNYAIEVWQGEMALGYLFNEKGRKRESNPGDEFAQFLFEHDCRACHTITFCYQKMFETPRKDGEWREVVERMHAKAPALIKEDDVPVLTNQIMKMRDKKQTR